MDNLERQGADRRARVVKVWLRSGYDVEYLTSYRKAVEDFSSDTLEEVKYQLQEKLKLIRTTNFDPDEVTNDSRYRHWQGRLGNIKDEQAHMVEIFIIDDELQYRGVGDD